MLNFWGPKKYKKVINSSTKCLISVKIAIMTPHIIPLSLVNVWLIFDLQKYVNWLCVFSKVNPFFQKAQVFCMDLQPAADPYNVVCRFLCSRVNSAQNQLGPNQVGPKPTRPKTKSAQNQLGPKLIGPGLGDPSPLFFSFLFSFSSPSFFFFFHPLYYHWEFISLKGVSIQKN